MSNPKMKIDLVQMETDGDVQPDWLSQYLSPALRRKRDEIREKHRAAHDAKQRADRHIRTPE